MLYNTNWKVPKIKSPPTFGRRWHSRSYLDIRPVLWSLRNHPEEWRQTEYKLIHEPSHHEFWIRSGFWFYSLYDGANCSCTEAAGGRFSYIQKIQFHYARRVVAALDRARRSAELAKINVQFAEHFTHG